MYGESMKTKPSHFFGFEPVTADEKTAKVKSVFDGVASKYDIMNDIMSMGVHRLWKNDFVKKIKASSGQTLLDVAGGTGDIGFRFSKANPECKVIFCDINESMLKQGKAKAYDQGKLKGLDWVVGNAESIPLPDNSVDYYTIAFGLRNVTNIDLALQEAFRVLKPGGRYLCLEFSHLKSTSLQKLYDQYSFFFLPFMGSLIAQDADSYRYLAESIRQFPKAKELVVRIEKVGFQHVTYDLYSAGIAAVHSGWKI